MQFKVPQFLDIEDKIFGDFTFRQFIYMVGGGGICFVLYKWLGLLIGAIPILAIGGLAGMLAFYRPNSKPFINMIEAWFTYSLQNKLYIWKRRKMNKKQHDELEKKETENNHEAVIKEAKLGRSKLRDLAWSLDVLDLENKNTGH